MQLNLDKTESGHLIDFPACLLLTGRQEICGRWEPAPNDMTASAAEGKTAWRPKEVQIYVYKWIVLLTISNPERWVKVNMLVYGTQVFKHCPLVIRAECKCRYAHLRECLWISVSGRCTTSWEMACSACVLVCIFKILLLFIRRRCAPHTLYLLYKPFRSWLCCLFFLAFCCTARSTHIMDVCSSQPLDTQRNKMYLMGEFLISLSSKTLPKSFRIMMSS